MRTLSGCQRLDRFIRICWLAAALLAVLTGCGQSEADRDLASDAPPTATDVLEKMVSAYRNATAYSDRGVLCLRYEQQGTRYHDEAPLAVVVEGDDHLRVHAYQATMVCDGRQLRARIEGSGSPEVDRQVLLVPAPGRLTLDSLLVDPILKEAVIGGAGRLPIQLELLLGEAPLEAILPAEVEKRLLPTSRIEGHPCHRVEVCTDEGKFVFWIDTSSHVLRRLEYPQTIVPASLGAQRPSLVAELRMAQFASTEARETFLVSVSPPERAVTSFVVPPPPLPTPLLGKQVAGFHFLDPAGADVTATGLRGRTSVLLWFSDHPACRTALEQLQQVRGRIDTNEVAMLAVCAESSQRSHAEIARLMREWRVTIPLVRDLRAFGRDLFAIPGAPALVVLDRNGVVQLFQVGVNPELATELPAILERVSQGIDVAGETRTQYEANLAKYREALKSIQ